jgi:hypothetical protein
MSSFDRIARACAFSLLVFLAPSVANAGLLLSVDFGPSFRPVPRVFTGVEASAAAANALFANANYWTGIFAANYNLPADQSPTFVGFQDSTGDFTSVRMNFVGPLKAFDFTDFFGPSAAPDALRDDFLFFNSGNNEATSLDWSLSELKPNTEYRFYLYGSRADEVRLFDMFVDTDGDGSLADEASQALGSASADRTATQDAYFVSVFSDATGTIHGRGVGRPGLEANWAGFQLAEVAAVPAPEVASLMMLGLVAMGLARRRQPA